MPDVTTLLSERLSAAVVNAFGDAYADADPLLSRAANPKFGDYQANLAMGLAKRVGAPPRDVAAKIVEQLDVEGVCDDVQIAGPGFINLTLTPAFLAEQVTTLANDDRLGVERAESPQTVVVDYSSPNVAKEMHVGHLRSTIIGDAIARVLESLGHKVIRQNHLGDWGTQFGMLIEHLIDLGFDDGSQHSIADLNELYQAAKKKDDADAAFAERARQRVVKLQGGDEATLALWRSLIDESKRHFNAVYQRLGVGLSDDDVAGESFYNDRLADVVGDLDSADCLKESQGARVVFPEGFNDRDGNPLPMIVQKSDGGFLYATTDLAAARFRIDDLHADRVVYVTDARQRDHFAMLFATLKQVGWAAGDRVSLEHVPFGMVLGPDKKPYKTREGGTVRLVDLLDEAEQRAADVIAKKGTDLDDAQRSAVARAVGIGALKYADLSNDRVKDYVFDWERMLAFEGNTAPYLQNAYVRIRSIFRKAASQGVGVSRVDHAAIQLEESAERSVALALLQFGQVVPAVASSLEPHRLCTYLYDLASAYHKFYEACPVLTAPDAATRDSRLRLSALTADVLRQGLELLGIDVVEQM